MEKDLFGPEYVIKVRDPKLGMTGFLVIHNTVLGPGKGGIRMTSNVTEEEVLRLATTMTWKNALSGIPFGGAKAGMVWPGGSPNLKKKFVQAFARALKPFLLSKYIAGPDVNSGETEMKWFVEAVHEWSAATGKPANYCEGKKCGIPHEYGSTGFGVAHSAKIAAGMIGLDLQGATVAIHGFGNVGTFAYKHLTEMGAKVILVADRDGAALNKDGFDPEVMQKIIDHKKHVGSYPKAQKIDSEDFWKVPVDILIPASVTDVINERNKNDIKTKLIVEGGNIPMRESVEEEFFRKGTMIVPDFVANAGGVISSYAEYAGLTPKKMFELVKEKISTATKEVLKATLVKNKNPRTAALEIAKSKIVKQMKRRKETF